MVTARNESVAYREYGNYEHEVLERVRMQSARNRAASAPARRQREQTHSAPRTAQRTVAKAAAPKKKPAAVRPKGKKKLGLKASVKPFLMICFGFAVAALLITRYANIASANSNIIALEKELKEERRITETLNVKLAQSGDLAAIQETAKNRLGMNYPAADQTVYLDVSLSGGDAGGGRATAQAIAKPTGFVDTVLGLLH